MNITFLQPNLDDILSVGITLELLRYSEAL